MRFSDPASPTPPGVLASLPKRVAARGTAAIPGRHRVGRRARSLRTALLLAAAAGSLGACSRPDAFAPACPQLALLTDGADLARFAGTGRDITDLVLDAHLTTVPAACRWADERHTRVEAKLQVAMALSRGPAMQGRTADLRYFVAVSEGDEILDKQVYAARADFPANTERLALSSPEISMLFPVSKEKSAAAYKITVSFQLTPEELAANRSHGGH